MKLSDFETLQPCLEEGTLAIHLNRPEARNALSDQMIDELMEVFGQLEGNRSVRAIVLRGNGGHFCAGADLKSMNSANSEPESAFKSNRRFGDLITAVGHLEQVVIAAIEGAVMGGGFGMVCVSDFAISTSTAKFGMPETTLGIPPAQIAPFVVHRIGLTQARRLALMGERISGTEACELGIVHQCVDSSEALDTAVQEAIKRVKRCAPDANAMTKALMLSMAGQPSQESLDHAARLFSNAVTGEEGLEGIQAFKEKRSPHWA
ncbi:enoyl-CoA hydratase/isomerase family protein [Endozoicomonas numazuensis]|uniref:Enoyl-CoA hydratase n=1 Tax=Endozoicomonas numazuensis TaxID=1137799 RepID=A0A081NIZ9_9GAMM|nr:enoyl-CoA hydratase-related protein [Endozoicomonas numazuensis]KEQ18422.1 enoyl-CoA hydratase [Endozoicomonas numazuensis]